MIRVWNLRVTLATSDIEGFFDIQAFDIEAWGCFDIEYTTFDIELPASRVKFRVDIEVNKKTFDIEETSISKVQPSISGSYIEVLRYWIGLLRYRCTPAAAGEIFDIEVHISAYHMIGP